MPSAWQTLEEAALTLGISSRTLHRRITRNEVQTRLNSGRREVLVEIPDPEPAPAVEIPAADDSHEIADPAPATVTAAAPADDNVRQTMLALSEDRIRRTDLAIMAYQQSVTAVAADARRCRNSARLAWSLTGTMVVALFVCVTLATHKLTAADASVQRLNEQLQTASAAADRTGRDAESLRHTSESARIAAAKVEGELAATRTELSATRDRLVHVAQPTTRPAPLLQRVVNVLGGD